MSKSKPSERIIAGDAVQFRTRDLIVMHLCEAARLGIKIKDHIDTKLFNHLIGMAIYAAQEGDDDSRGEIRLNS